MAAPLNRAEVLMANWREKEKNLMRFGEASGSTGREMMFQQYTFLREGVCKLSLRPKPHEKANLRLIKGSMARMERQLWPNPVVRLLAKLMAELFVKPKLIKEFKKMKGMNERELKGFLSEKGFGVLVAKLESELDFERPWFSMKMSGELEEARRMEMELQVVKLHDGKYYPSLIDATLVQADGRKLNHEFLLSDYMLDAGQVTNLMQGRAVSVMDRDGRGGELELWLQVQFEKGDSYLRRFYPDFGFDAGKLLGEFAVSIGKVDLDDGRLLAELKKGNQVSFVAGAPFNRTLCIEADPSVKQLLIRNELGEAQEMGKLMERKNAFAKELERGISVDLNLKAEPQKSKALQNGIGI